MIDFLTEGSIYHLNQRTVASITLVIPDEPLALNTKGSLWVLGFNASAVLDRDLTIGTTEAWVSGGHQSVSMQGSGIVIDNPGMALNERCITSLTPGIPGQLSYIDACSNSNLINPARNGDPCVNYLYFPPGIDQTWHTHPSVRVGLVISGQGSACIKHGDNLMEFPLEMGKGFVLHRHSMHRFKTFGSQHMSLLVWHPDSEDGPQDEANPMKTRTYFR
jgi:hypothetical protein